MYIIIRIWNFVDECDETNKLMTTQADAELNELMGVTISIYSTDFCMLPLHSTLPCQIDTQTTLSEFRSNELSAELTNKSILPAFFRGDLGTLFHSLQVSWVVTYRTVNERFLPVDIGCFVKQIMFCTMDLAISLHTAYFDNLSEVLLGCVRLTQCRCR